MGKGDGGAAGREAGGDVISTWVSRSGSRRSGSLLQREEKKEAGER